jgi:hypothetical protein
MHRLAAMTSVAALSALVMGSAPAPSRPADLDQGWTAEQRKAWYEASQGSRLLPFDWLKALEQPGDGGRTFLDDDFIAGFRYLPAVTSYGEHLPVGFSLDATDSRFLSSTDLRWKAGQGRAERWVGMNCAACHTAELTYRGQALRVDGGPTLADFQGFLEALDQSLLQTRDTPARFDRFAARVLRGEDSPANRELLRAALNQLVIQRQAVGDLNATTMRYGYGRLDAIGRIFNQLAWDLKSGLPLQNPPDAPVSYPFLWNVPQHERLEWNGLTPSVVIRMPTGHPFDVGALARNTGEVIGVFGDLTVRPKPGLAGYASSIDIGNLAAFEQMLGQLKPPKWPSELFGTPDPTLVQKGEGMFMARCASCHQPLARDDLTTRIPIRMSLFKGSDSYSPPGTDIWMACNAYTYKGKTGLMAGTPSGFLKGPPFGEEAPMTDLLEVAVKGALAGRKWDVAKTATRSFFGVQRPPAITKPALPPGAYAIEVEPDRDARAQTCLQETSDVLGYKIRPLTGIWATAPYLHNGSVPSLYDLLLPEDQRPAAFYMGSREFDPVKVGFHYGPEPANSFLFRTRDEQGRLIPGNSNAGHDYGNAQLSQEDRKALVAYLKTL